MRTDIIVVNSDWAFRNALKYFDYIEGDPHAEELDIGEKMVSLVSDVFEECGFVDFDMLIVLPDGYTKANGSAPFTLESILGYIKGYLNSLFDHTDTMYRTMHGMWSALHAYLQEIGVLDRSRTLGFDC